MATGHGRARRHRNFYRELDALLDQIDDQQGLEGVLTHILERVTEDFGQAVGLESGRLYRDDGEEYVVVRSFGSRGKEILGFRVPRDYSVFAHLMPGQTAYFEVDDPRVDSELENSLGVGHFAAFLVGPARDYIAAFGLDEEAEPDEVMLVLNTLRHAIEHRLREEELEGQLIEARTIQMSLLPEEPPTFEGFELAGCSIPADEVGGDIIDFVPMEGDLLGVAVGDASGHGLPAALQARDVVTGLRMGVEKDLKITAVVERLNRVIHQSGLTSRFVSLFYGELDSGGGFFYVNGGHDPGMVMRADGRVEWLRSTGLVLGPVDGLSYRRGYISFGEGDSLLLYTDGIVERQGVDGEYGPDRMEAFVRKALSDRRPIAEIPEALIQDTFDFGHGQPWADDVTALLVHRVPDEE